MQVTDSTSTYFNLGAYSTATDIKNQLAVISAPTGSSDYDQGAYNAYYNQILVRIVYINASTH